MEVKLLLLKAICLVYYRSHTNTGVTPSSELLIQQVMDRITLPEDIEGMGRERNYLLRLRSVLLWMTRNPPEYVYDINDLMARIRVAVDTHDQVYDMYLRNILPTDQDTAENRVVELTNELTQYVAMEELTTLLRSASRKIGMSRESISDVAAWRAELMAKMEALPIEGKKRLNTLARIVDVGNIEEVTQIFEAAQAHIDPKLILKFPFAGLNDFTGPQQGLRRGDWSIHCALPGQNKSGILLDTFCGWALLNDPHPLDSKKIPTLVYVTIEDALELVFQKIYTVLKQLEHNMPVKVVGVPFSEMAEYVQKTLEHRGWKVFIMSFPVGGHNEEYLQIFRDLEDHGYEVAAVACDYVNLIGKQGIPAVVSGDEIKYLHRKLRGYFNSKAITHCTPHQLGPKAKEAFRIDPVDYIRRLKNQGMFEGCSSLDTEPDFLFYVDKAEHSKGYWQQFQFDKHRRIGQLPDHLHYFAMKFHKYPMMGMKWDALEDKPQAFDKVGGMKPRSKSNWELMAEVNDEVVNGHSDGDELEF